MINFSSVFFELVKQVSSDSLKIDITKLLEHLLPNPTDKMTDKHIRSLFFGDYGKPEGEKIYDEITDLDELAQVMDG